MTIATDGEESGNILGGMIGEALAIGGLTAFWVVAVAATNWLSVLHGAVPLVLQALSLAGATAFAMLTFQKWSGGHVNPLMTLSIGLAGLQTWRPAVAYSIAHIAGALAAFALTYAFVIERPVFPVSEARVIAEFLGAAVVVNVIVALRNEVPVDAALGTGAAVALIYWISGGVTLVNPAITLAQGLFGLGLDAVLAGPVIAAQFFGALSGYYLARLLWP
jgi:glycerol uptake facilitator-like aquaporin